MDGLSKREWRADISARRRARSQDAREEAAHALAVRALALPAVASAETVAGYVSFPSEPGTGPLLASLRERGVRVLLPVLLDDLDLDWADGSDRLGVGAVADADVVVCPALAVDSAGNRLGKGGGSYDRALARVRPGTAVVALLYDDELVDELPAEPHDRRVGGALTPLRSWP